MNSRFKIPTEVFTSEAQYDVIPALGRLRQKDHMIGTSKASEFSATLGHLARLCSQQRKKGKGKERERKRDRMYQ